MPHQTPGAETVTILCAALSDPTALPRFSQRAPDGLAEGAWIITTQGDALLIAAPTAAAAAKTAMLLRHAVHCEPSWPPLRVGIHAGELLEATLQLAAGVAARARGGQILCTRPVVRALTATEFVFRPLGALRVEDAPLEAFELVDGAPSALVEVDPVCGRRVDPLKVLHRQPSEGRMFFFCSARCQRTFAAPRRPRLRSARSRLPAPPA